MKNRSVIQLREQLAGNCVVALDTNVLCALEDGPAWFGQFVEMREAGVKFSIPDLCIGERLNRFEHADPNYHENMKDSWNRMVSRLDVIIWHDLPCLPLRGDLCDLVGIRERGCEQVRENPFSAERSRKLYRLLHDYADSPYNRKGQRDLCIEEFKNVRSVWKEWILSCREKKRGKTSSEMYNDYISGLESDFEAPEGIRNLFELPVRFAAECAYDHRYIPTDDDDCRLQEKKPSNDGLDYAILFLTMASINICSYDKLFKRVGSMKFHRSCCCHKPGEIYAKWRTGKLSHVVLPQVATVGEWV